MNANAKYIAKHTSNLHDKYVVPADKTQNNSAMKRKLKKG